MLFLEHDIDKQFGKSVKTTDITAACNISSRIAKAQATNLCIDVIDCVPPVICSRFGDVCLNDTLGDVPDVAFISNDNPKEKRKARYYMCDIVTVQITTAGSMRAFIGDLTSEIEPYLRSYIYWRALTRASKPFEQDSVIALALHLLIA